MKIELFMRSLEQDFSDDSLSEFSEVSYNNKSHRQRIYVTKSNSNFRFLDDVKIRKESFGGLLYDLRTKAVFSLDQEAYDSIKDLLDGIEYDELIVKRNISNDNLIYLKDSLIKYNLCTN